ncbi:hypothetical protein SAMN05421736_108175 [Evansella caseinilytica]|uniref:Uncharacterized protein n=1 Tax=Evansella caseinilytica TaxID=1503961 RepID=A0A1H3RLI4_9BACI|nr:hypothetical protein SAMN05421736_108175 [Evansella caseinilytica]
MDEAVSGLYYGIRLQWNRLFKGGRYTPISSREAAMLYDGFWIAYHHDFVQCFSHCDLVIL